jgi:hypothetical protein
MIAAVIPRFLRRPRRFGLLYPAWLLLCAVLFLALRHADDPSRPEGRVLSIDAGRQALAYAQERGYRGYEVVHVARARKGEGGEADRWVVLLDQVPHTRLRSAIVVEIDELRGELLGIRLPRR